MVQEKKKLLIIKVGRTLPALLTRRGDFEDWILAGMGVKREQTIVAEVSNGHKLPDCRDISGIVITGSHSMVTEHRDWSEYAARWLPQAVDQQIPTLGICYGHQLLAYSLGGKVANNPNGREFGTIEVRLNGMARNDLLLQDLDSPIKVHVCHTQSVLNLPPNAKLLASSDRDQNQAFVVGDCVWGVQFHPEFDAEIVAEYIYHYRQLLAEEGTDPDEALNNVSDTAYGPEILARFYKIVKDHGRTT